MDHECIYKRTLDTLCNGLKIDSNDLISLDNKKITEISHMYFFLQEYTCSMAPLILNFIKDLIKNYENLPIIDDIDKKYSKWDWDEEMNNLIKAVKNKKKENDNQ